MEALPRRLLELGERGALLDYGIVDSADPLTVKIGGSTIAVPAVPLDSYYPEAGDYVAVLTHGADLLVLGRASPTRERLRLAATNDASLISTLHAFQIGPDDGSNLIADNNEIIARNNGAAGSLFIQTEGGGLSLGGASTEVNTAGEALYPLGSNSTSGWTPAAGWSIEINQCRREGAHCWIAGTATRTGSNITVNANGDINNINPVATASGTPANGNSNFYWGLANGANGRLASWVFNPSNGQLALCAVSPGGDIATNNTLSFAGVVPVQVR